MKDWIRCVGVQVGLWLVVIPAMAGAQPAGAPTPVESVVVALIDPSLRSPLAAPTAEVVAEVADDTKRLTGKVGFTLRPKWSGEVGFTGAFDDDDLSKDTANLRRLTDGSSVWGATTWIQSSGNRRATPLLSTRLEASRAEFDFYDMALSRHTAMHTAYAVTATAGLLLPKEHLVAVSYRWSQSWQVEDQGDSCHFVTERGGVQCPADRLFRAPAAYQRHQLEAQVQARLGNRVGAEVFVTRDFRDDAWGIDVPVYFIARPGGGFTGGLVFTYNGARDAVDLSVFVGQVFTLFK